MVHTVVNVFYDFLSFRMKHEASAMIIQVIYVLYFVYNH